MKRFNVSIGKAVFFFVALLAAFIGGAAVWRSAPIYCQQPPVPILGQCYVVLKYDDFSSSIVSNPDFLGQDFWQWDTLQPDPHATFDIKVVVYGDDYTQQQMKQKFPVIPELEQDYRYLPYAKARVHFAELKRGYQFSLARSGTVNPIEACYALSEKSDDEQLIGYCGMATINQYWPITAMAIEKAMQSCKKKPIQ